MAGSGGGRQDPGDDLAAALRELKELRAELGGVKGSQDRVEAAIAELPHSLAELLREEGQKPRMSTIVLSKSSDGYGSDVGHRGSDGGGRRPFNGGAGGLCGGIMNSGAGSMDRFSLERSELGPNVGHTGSVGHCSLPSSCDLSRSGTVLVAPRTARQSLRSTTGSFSAETELGPDASSKVAIAPPSMKSWVSKSVIYETEMSQDYDNGGRCLPRKIRPIKRDSRFRTAFDACAFLAVLWDLVFLPYQFAWDQWTDPMISVGNWVTRIFWTLDLLLNFVTSRTHRMKKEDTFRDAALRYVKGWFTVDLMLVSVDWTEFLVFIFTSQGSRNGIIFLKAIRALRLVRIVRNFAILRTGRLDQLYETLLQKIARAGVATHVQVTVSLCRMLAVVLWLNHIVCCLWYRVVQDSSNLDDAEDGPLGWTQQLAYYQNTENFADKGVQMYVMGLYWAASTMFSGSSFLHPSGVLEAVFSQICVIFGALLISVVISKLSARLVQMEIDGHEREEKMRVLRRFLHEHEIEPALSLEVQKQFKQRTAGTGRLAISDVPALASLSSSLRSALREIIYSPYLTKHPVFWICDSLDDTVMQDICTAAINHTSAKPGQEFFTASSEMEFACVIMVGTLKFSFASRVRPSTFTSQSPASRLQSSTFSEARQADMVIVPGMWVCEIALWVRWKSLGLLEAETACEALLVSVQGMEKALLMHPESARVFRDYGASVCQIIDKEYTMDTSDLSVGIDHEVIVANMPRESRVLMSMPAVESLRDARSLWGASVLFTGWAPAREVVLKIEDEVKAGLCNLCVDEESGQALRVVQVAVLRLVSTQGLCVKLADLVMDSPVRGHTRKGLTDNVVVGLSLPGTEVYTDELPQDALARMVGEELEPLAAGIQQKSLFDVTHDFGECRELALVSSATEAMTHLRKKVVRTTFHAELDKEHRNPDIIKLEDPDEDDETVMHRNSSLQSPASAANPKRFFRWSSSLRSSGVNGVFSVSSHGFRPEGWAPFAVRGGKRDPSVVMSVYAWVPPEEWRRMQQEEKEVNSFVRRWLRTVDFASACDQATSLVIADPVAARRRHAADNNATAAAVTGGKAEFEEIQRAHL